jgi:glutamate formiminotransferase / formiminotetrahydrofolate cyclodeaminase
MPQQLVECVPNFSEGRDDGKIAQIADAVRSVAGVQLMDVDPGRDTNRTVVTFVGPPQAAAEAAFRAIAKAAEVIDMRVQQGSHPRMGATDVCPFVPIDGVTMEDCVELARQVGRRVGQELDIPVYLYEAAATTPDRQNLSTIRKGEYEGLAEKLRDPKWAPDFGRPVFNPRSGATVLGARDFLIAYNITLNTRDRNAATDIAFELREKGRVARTKTASPYYQDGAMLHYEKNHYPCGNCDFAGKTFADTESHCRAVHGYELRELAAEAIADFSDVVGKKIPRAGRFKCCKAIGWYADVYKRAQISINLTNYHVTPPHLVLEEARKLAEQRGLVVTGSEIVGLIPFAALLGAGKYYLRRQGRSEHIPITDILETAVFSMGLNDVQPFDVAKKVIGLPARNPHGLAGKTVYDFVDEVSRDTPAPGGGSIAALAGSLGAALSSMVANISHPRVRGDHDKQERISRIAEQTQRLKDELLAAIDADADAFNTYLAALRMPAITPEEKALRERKMQEGLRQAVEVPYQTALAGYGAMQAAREMVEIGHEASITDAGVGCEIAYTAVRGGTWNVLVNLKEIKDPGYVDDMRTKCEALLRDAKSVRDQNEEEIGRKLSGAGKSK